MKSEELFSRICHLMHTLLRECTPELVELGLDTREFLLLSKVEQYPYPAQLASELFLPPSTITFLTKRLEKKGVLERKTVPNDLRRFRFLVTAKGRKLIKDGKAALQTGLGKRMSGMSKQEIRLFVGFIEQLERK